MLEEAKPELMSRTCVICDGEGRHVDYEDTSFAMYFTRCERCDGKGYIEKEAQLVGETISFGGGKVPESSLVQGARQKYNDTLPSRWKGKAREGHRQVLDWYGYLELCDALEERERLVQAWEEAVRRTRSAYPESVFRPGPPYRTVDAQSADWARRVCDNIIAEAKEIFEARVREEELGHKPPE